jgi:hypothetical protein
MSFQSFPSLSLIALMAERFIPPHGGYESLLSFQKARIVYDGTVRGSASASWIGVPAPPTR